MTPEKTILEMQPDDVAHQFHLTINEALAFQGRLRAYERDQETIKALREALEHAKGFFEYRFDQLSLQGPSPTAVAYKGIITALDKAKEV